MNNEIMLNNLSDDSKIKEYMMTELAPRVYHDIPIATLNTGFFSMVNEYLSQTIEQQSFTAAMYLNESSIMKAMLPDSIYSHAALFDIGYSFAEPSTCNFLLELKIDDIVKNSKINPNNGLYEFILDKNTKINLSNGNVYSLDYDILIQYKNIETAARSSAEQAWNIQYTNIDNSNSVARNKDKDTYIKYRVTDVWLCLFVTAAEYERTKYIVTNNSMNGIPNPDKVISCLNHICGFDIYYVKGNGTKQLIPHDHILPIHGTVNDNDPYVHYIMDNPQSIHFMFQLCGNRYFVPEPNSSYEIIVYTCHGESANFTAFNNEYQPSVITASNVYSNNANVMKAAFVISGSQGGVNIGTVENVRRDTIMANKTVNVISTDSDVAEWFKSFFFKRILYPFFFKRRDDPWCKIWSGSLALKDTDDYIFRTNTLTGLIPYNVLYNNNDNIVGNNEVIIPPGWIWIYNNNENRCTVIPYTAGDGITVETAKTLSNINEKFVFANPFGIRIQKEPFAIGYFNPWINEYVTCTRVITMNDNKTTDNNNEDLSYIYHATPIVSQIMRTYREDYYKFTTYISPSISTWIDGKNLVQYVRQNAVAPIFSSQTWNYFKEPLDMFCESIPMLSLTEGHGYIPFDPAKTFLCVRNRNRVGDNKWQLSDIWIDDMSTEGDNKRVFIPITGDITMLYGHDDIWGDNGLWKGYEEYVSGNTVIGLTPSLVSDDHLIFARVPSQQYYELRLDADVNVGHIVKIVVGEATVTSLTKFGLNHLVKIGRSYASQTFINVYFSNGITKQFAISNAANIYTQYDFVVDEFGQCVFELDNVGANSVILYCDMKPTPDSGAIDYYKIPLSLAQENIPLFYIENKLLPMKLNNMRVVLHAMMNGSEVGYVEMQPIRKEQDGSYCFEACMYPMNELVDIDNRINIASIDNGGGSWITFNPGSTISVDATNPELKISVFVRSSDELRDSDINIDDSFTGFRIVDQYMLDDISLIQELKEMRSTVNFGESSIPSEQQMLLYKGFISLDEYNASIVGNLWDLEKVSYDHLNGIQNDKSLIDMQNIINYINPIYDELLIQYGEIIGKSYTLDMTHIDEWFEIIMNETDINNIDWDYSWHLLKEYKNIINTAFEGTNVNCGLEIQLLPMTEYSLLNSERFPSFVNAFTQVHKAIEPCIFSRFEGNNYLDCKLIGTYGLPHSYTSDIDKDNMIYWPDLNVQLEFNVKLYNASLTTNTLNELRSIVKAYFNRLTNIHTPIDVTSMDNNIYISHLIQQMEGHVNVAYMKFIGWYTNEKNKPDGDYKDANTQAIVQCYDSIDKFPKKKLETYIPEMFVLDDENIVLNVI